MPRTRFTCLFLTASLTFAPALALLTFPPAARAADEKADAKKDGKEKKEGPEYELQKHMEVMDESMKKLRRTLRAADQNAESLKLIGEVKKAAEACKPLVPTMVKDVPAGERDKFVASYRKDLEAFIAEVGKIETAVKAGKNDEANEIYKKLKEMESDGHEKYNK